MDERDGRAEVLEVGRDPRTRRPVPPVSRWVALGLVLVLGLVAGSGATYWFLDRRAEQRSKAAVQLLARLDGGIAIVDPTDGCATATVRLYNVGAHPLTVDEVNADLTGQGMNQSRPFCQLQESTPHPIVLRPRASEPWTIVFRLACDQIWGTPTYRATVTTVLGERREVSAPMEKPDAPPSANFSCDGSPDISWNNLTSPLQGTGRDTSLLLSGVIRTTTGRQELLSLRLSDDSGLRMTLEPESPLSLKNESETIGVRVSVADCEQAQAYPDSSIQLRVRTRLGMALVDVPFDEPRAVTRSLVRLVDAVCGSQG
ncbi:hypothetical protein [Tenggerimyces flavus]|uniref:Uncharacterized protein n=1 Tax=Tenggerimyces flavus TaxID=1708749 RepID=A0ABV7YAA2_9ACTN|nr:hypothetical protein [Tenggerimyces flavus]MBM7789105.1 hypothetical protein [Tenggerimyces flavus]